MEIAAVDALTHAQYAVAFLAAGPSMPDWLCVANLLANDPRPPVCLVRVRLLGRPPHRRPPRSGRSVRVATAGSFGGPDPSVADKAAADAARADAAAGGAAARVV